jgi:hypothetical protein
VNLLRDAGHLSKRGRGILMRRVDRIQDAVSGDKPRRARDQIRRMLKEMDDIRERDELSRHGERVLETTIDRLKAVL